MIHLFEKFGIELEYMIVRATDFGVAPMAAELISDFCGEPLNDCTIGDCAVSNELAAHVIEVKTPEPLANFQTMEERFVAAIQLIQEKLSARGARLLPGPMHPFMDPARESFTWPYEGREIYSLYDSIFDCHGHGWFNLQSCHLNLPFADDDEFARLHSAVLLLLPLMPALTAASPFRDGALTGLADTRIDIYRHNQDKCPAIVGPVIPEAVFSRREYEERILQPIYRQIAPHDPRGILAHEWLNSRGAIARFDRNAIEIRLLDVQECPAADLAIAQLFIRVLRELVEHPEESLRQWAISSPASARTAQLNEVVKAGLDAPLQLTDLREALAIPPAVQSAGDFWRHLFHRHSSDLPMPAQKNLEHILRAGNLSARLTEAHRQLDDPRDFTPILRELACCLHENRIFTGL